MGGIDVRSIQAELRREGLRFGEAPRWRGGRLWYSDFYRHAVFSMAADGSDESGASARSMPTRVANQVLAM